jgi:hypothetical protein
MLNEPSQTTEQYYRIEAMVLLELMVQVPMLEALVEPL